MSLETRDQTGASVLSVAAASGEKDIVLYLISKGSNVEVCLAIFDELLSPNPMRV